jgi:hypothetical protein
MTGENNIKGFEKFNKRESRPEKTIRYRIK